MQQKGKCLALGAGAIGKSVSGYIFTQLGFDFRYAEIDDAVISDINRRGGYDLYTAVSGDQIKKQEIRGILMRSPSQSKCRRRRNLPLKRILL